MTHPDGVAVFPEPKLRVLHDAVLAKCDTLDGVKDGLLENPLSCSFDPKEIECRSGDGPDCLNTAQVDAARKVYAGPSNPRTNERVWPGLYRGSELDWTFFTGAAGPVGIATSTLRDMVLKDPTWDYKTARIDYDRHVTLADQSDIARVNASNADISAFVKQGGKLILSGGWNNALVPAGAVLDYYERVRKTLGPEQAQRAVRLYMVPGMIECNGGPGTDTFDMLGVMRRWVEPAKRRAKCPPPASSTGRWSARGPCARFPRSRPIAAAAARTTPATSRASSVRRPAPRCRGIRASAGSWP